jgi:hypothetical protein
MDARNRNRLIFSGADLRDQLDLLRLVVRCVFLLVPWVGEKSLD